MTQEMMIMAAILVAVILITFIGILSRYRKCKSDEVLVVYGKTGGDKKSAKLYHGGAAFVWPIVQGYEFLSMKPMQIDCKLTGALSAQNIRVDVPTTITVAISTDPEVMQNAAERMLGLTMDDKQNLITDVVYGQMRLVIADMTIEELNSDRDKFLSKVKDNIDTELRKFGLYLMNINISDIRDAANYIVNLGKEAESKAQNEAQANIEEQEKLIDEMKSLKNEAVRLQNFELAASYRDKEKEYTNQLDTLKEEWEKSLKENRETVDDEQIAEVVSMMSGVPVQRMAQAEGMKLLGMKDDLLSKVIGQDKAIATLVKAIQRSRVGLKDPNKPIGTFMFLGPTGVGKTHLAKELAKLMFGSADALIRIDMSEYMEKFTVSRLVGAPPGYVGYEEGGQLTEKVRRKPYSIVLLDEIEKAHPDVFNILLQVMDEGRLTDSYGRTVDFKNTIVIMTSNIGTRQLKEFGKGIGFAAQIRTDDKEYSRSVITKALNKSFAPEFINRLDEIITFDQLDLNALTRIIDIELKGLYSRVEHIGYKLVIDEDAKKFVATKGYDVQFGARPLKRAIQNNLEDGISELILGSEMAAGDTIKVSYDKEKDIIVMTVEK